MYNHEEYIEQNKQSSSGWRLPIIQEWASLITYEKHNPSCDLEDLYYFDETFKMHYYFTWKEKQYRKLMKKYGVDSSVKNVNGKHIALNNEGQHISIIFSRDGRQDVLAHECVHAGIFLLNEIGQEIKDDEVLPYLIESLVRNFNRIKN